MKNKDVRISKLLSYVLRHKPESIGLTLDAQGWANIDELVSKSSKVRMTREDISRVVRGNDKQRFIISDDGNLIRANQGHSIKVDLGLKPVSPPDSLFHGTATRFWPSIQVEGLKKMNRQHVHLSEDEETAAKVGVRHGKLQILTVDCRAMVAAGHIFYVSENGVWLTETVPPQFLSAS
ncbi:MAG: RNA 2'-phosphotransferase [Hellea sp.]